MESRMLVLGAVGDALFPPLPAQAAAADAALDPATAQLLRHAGASDEVILKVIETVETRLTPESRRELYLLLRLLSSRLGTLLLLGRAAFASGFSLPAAFADLPRAQREAVLLGWALGSDARMRKAFKGLKSLLMSAQFTQLGSDGTSPLLAALGYPTGDPQRPPAPAPPAAAAEAAVAAALVDLSCADASPGAAAGAGAALAAKGLRVLWPGELGCAAAARERPQLSVQCDVVVVGSGAGGGVAAANLAAAGLRVVVLEKAGFVPARDMTLQEGQAFGCMYEQGGIMTSEDGAVAVLAGATLGGGTRVNWCASFRTPAHVRREWAENYGLPDFAQPKYEEALDAVCSRLGVQTGFKHSAMCSALRSGLQGVGAHCGEVPRNCQTADCGGHCCLGCARGYKQDAINTWLADACQAGARVITGVYADRVLLESHDGEPLPGGHKRRRRAVGVLALAGPAAAPLRLAIQAPVVISAAGSLNSPALLLRSGVSCRGAVGASLRLHPCTCVVGAFPPPQPNSQEAVAPAQQQQQQQQQGQPGLPDLEDLVPAGSSGKGPAGPEQQQEQQQQQGSQRRVELGGGAIRCWEGTLMSIFSNHVADWEGSGYGSLLYTPAVHPGLFAAAAPWLGGEDYKQLLLQYANCCVVLVLVRDQDPGRIAVDRSGRPRVHYSLSKRDEASMMKGVELGLRCMAAAGAHTVLTMLNSPDGRFTFTEPPALGSLQPSSGHAESRLLPPLPGSSSGGQEAFEEFVGRVGQAGVVPLQMPLFSAHQMGTCRLGADPTSSALDPAGECWDVSGLYCMDGSTLPTPTGVNPMISIEATSYMLSKQLGVKLARQSGDGKAGSGSRRGSSRRSPRPESAAAPCPKL